MSTKEQITEGRDEALEHLGKTPEQWRSTQDRCQFIRLSARCSPLDREAALTVAEAEVWLASNSASVLGQLAWMGTVVAIRMYQPAKKSDYGLQA